MHIRSEYRVPYNYVGSMFDLTENEENLQTVFTEGGVMEEDSDESRASPTESTRNTRKRRQSLVKKRPDKRPTEPREHCLPTSQHPEREHAMDIELLELLGW